MKKFRDIVSKDKVSGFEAAARNGIANRKQLDEEFELKLTKLTEEKVMKKQTAVDIFHDRVIEMLGRKRPLTTNEVAKTWLELKEMEKEQIVDAHIEGQRLFDEHDHTQWTTEQAEQYYKKTYEQ